MSDDNEKLIDAGQHAEILLGAEMAKGTLLGSAIRWALATIDSQASALAEAKAEIEQAHEALDTAGVARGAEGHSVRYRIGLLAEDRDEWHDEDLELFKESAKYKGMTREATARAEAAEARCAKLERRIREVVAAAPEPKPLWLAPLNWLLIDAEAALASPSEPAGRKE